MSPRAAWRLERLGFGPVYDYTLGKVDWMAAGLPTVRADRSARRVIDEVDRDPPTCPPDVLVRDVGPFVRDVIVVNDHSIVLGELRAHAAAFGPLAVVMLDAHADTLLEEAEGDPFSHGTPLRRAVEEGIIDPNRSVLAGMRGSVLDSEELADLADLEVQLIRYLRSRLQRDIRH